MKRLITLLSCFIIYSENGVEYLVCEYEKEPLIEVVYPEPESIEDTARNGCKIIEDYLSFNFSDKDI